jgi:hypothetical protein
MLISMKEVTSYNNNISIKFSWALANWCCNLKEIPEKSCIDILKKLLDFSLCNKEKIIQNGVRGLGFFIKNVSHELFEKIICKH